MIVLTEQNRRHWALWCPDPTVMTVIRRALTYSEMTTDPVSGQVVESGWEPFYWQAPNDYLIVAAGLVPRLLAFLKGIGAPVTVHRNPPPVLDLRLTQNWGRFTFRDWQWSLIQKTCRYPQGIVQVPTSGGKSFGMGGIALNAAKQGVNSLITVPTQQILDEMVEKLQALIPREMLGVFMGGKQNKRLAPVTIGITNSLVKHPEDVRRGDFQVVMADECHRAVGQVGQVIDALNPTWLYGFSASALTDANVQAPLSSLSKLEWKLLSTYGELCFYIEPGTMAADNVLPFRYYQIFCQTGVGTGNDWTSLRQEVLETEEAKALYIELCRYLSLTGSNTLCLVPTKKFGEEMAERLRAMGVSEAVSFGQGKCWVGGERTDVKTVREWLQGQGRVLIGTSHLDEGADKIVTNVHNGVFAVGGGKTERKLLQRTGRLLRPAPGKLCALIFDTYDRGSGVTRRHSDLRMETARLLKALEARVITIEQFYYIVNQQYGGIPA